MQMPTWRRAIGVAAPLIALLLFAGCGGDADPPPALYVPADTPSTGIPSAPNLVPTSTDIFPATGVRGLVLNNCASCHAVVCAAIGQRTQEEWAAVEASHLTYIPGLSMEDLGKIFDYLRRNFNDTLPEPDVPASLMPGGCPQLPAP